MRLRLVQPNHKMKSAYLFIFQRSRNRSSTENREAVDDGLCDPCCTSSNVRKFSNRIKLVAFSFCTFNVPCSHITYHCYFVLLQKSFPKCYSYSFLAQFGFLRLNMVERNFHVGWVANELQLFHPRVHIHDAVAVHNLIGSRCMDRSSWPVIHSKPHLHQKYRAVEGKAFQKRFSQITRRLTIGFCRSCWNCSSEAASERIWLICLIASNFFESFFDFSEPLNSEDIVTDTMNEFFVDNCGCYSCGQFVQSAFYTLLHITRTIGIGKPSPNGGIWGINFTVPQRWRGLKFQNFKKYLKKRACTLSIYREFRLWWNINVIPFVLPIFSP